MNNKFNVDLTKPGETVKKFSLNLTKPIFLAECFWDSVHDLDVHALLLKNTKLQAEGDIVSCYNLSNLVKNQNGSFSTKNGSLKHSGDCRDGKGQDIDEVLTINGDLISPEIDEIALFITIHPKNAPACFSEVSKAGVRLKDDSGKLLCEAQLSNQFGEFNAVQMGSLMRNNDKWEFALVGSGFKGDFNTILEHFS